MNKLPIAIISLTLFLSCSFQKKTDNKIRVFPKDKEININNFWTDFTNTKTCHKCDTAYCNGVSIKEIDKVAIEYAEMLFNNKDKASIEAINNCITEVEDFQKAYPKSNMFSVITNVLDSCFSSPKSKYTNDLYLSVLANRRMLSKFTSENDKYIYAYDVCMLKINKIGGKANNIDLQTISGQHSDLYNIKSTFVLLLFSNPDCSDCNDLYLKIKDNKLINKLLETKQLTILNLYIEQDISMWKEKAKKYPQSWINACNYTFKIRTDLSYSINNIPCMYLLDKDKNVLLKNVRLNYILKRLEKI